MPETFEKTAIRKINGLERQVRDINRRQYGYTLNEIIGEYQALPALRGFWTFSSINESRAAYDFSHQNRTLTNVGVAPYLVTSRGVPMYWVDGSTQYWSRPDEAGLDITGSLTIGGWFYHYIPDCHFAKLGASGAYSYMLDTDAGYARFIVSSTGTNAPQVRSQELLSTSGWSFIVGRFIPSTSQMIYLNGKTQTVSTGVVASIFNSTAPLTVGARGTGANGSRGYGSLLFICAGILSLARLDRLYEMTRPFFVGL